MPHDTFISPATAQADLDLVALVGSRLCHDLISPLGAIGNGVELLTMTGGAPGPELQLISESVTAAHARVKFFRVAFGKAREGQAMGQPELVRLMQDLSLGGRTGYRWLVAGDQPRQLVKLAFLAILCVEPALPRGGEIVIKAQPDGWRVRGTTLRTRMEPPLWAALDGKAADLSPAQVQFALLPREAATIGIALHWSLTETEAVIRF